MRLEIIFTIVFVMIMPLSVYAQDLSPSQKITKDSKMDSVLTQIYNSNQQGAGIPSSINPNVIIDETKIQIVIEFHSNQYTIPDNLGIQVESTYENMVQVVMPIANLEQLANQDDVKFLRLPNFADNKPIIPDSEPEILKDVPSNLFFLIIIPIVIILIIWRIRRGKKIVEI